MGYSSRDARILGNLIVEKLGSLEPKDMFRIVRMVLEEAANYKEKKDDLKTEAMKVCKVIFGSLENNPWGMSDTGFEYLIDWVLAERKSAPGKTPKALSKEEAKLLVEKVKSEEVKLPVPEEPEEVVAAVVDFRELDNPAMIPPE